MMSIQMCIRILLILMNKMIEERKAVNIIYHYLDKSYKQWNHDSNPLNPLSNEMIIEQTSKMLSINKDLKERNNNELSKLKTDEIFDTKKNETFNLKDENNPLLNSEKQFFKDIDDKIEEMMRLNDN